jgi:hypothetical protein
MKKKTGMAIGGIIVLVILAVFFIPGLFNWFMGFLGDGSCYDFPWDPDCDCPPEENKTSFVWMGGITKYFCDDGWWVNPNNVGWEEKVITEGTIKMQNEFPDCTSLPCKNNCGDELPVAYGYTQDQELIVIMECREYFPGGATSYWAAWFYMKTGEFYSPGSSGYPYCGDCPT